MKITCLVGMIASSKSTYAKHLARQGAIIVNDDDIVNLVHGGCYDLYDKSLKALYKGVENNLVLAACCLKRDIVFDRGLNVSKDGRRRILAIARSLDIDCEAVVFPNEGVEEHAFRRFEKDNRGRDLAYWLMVASHHNSAWAYPALDEGFSKVTPMTYQEVLKLQKATLSG